jgi:hypothetical protein
MAGVKSRKNVENLTRDNAVGIATGYGAGRPRDQAQGQKKKQKKKKT